MKVKELLKMVNVAWSPPAQQPILLAAGTAAQQLDASFNTTASLELYSLNLQQAGYDMILHSSVPSDHRFHKIIWGAHGTDPAGIIAGGCDYGMIKIYSASKLMSREADCLMCSPERHTGPVRTLDFNPFQTNLLASGASESEIYIWDVINTKTPMNPGPKSQPLEDVQYIQWNKQVQHILASAFSQRCIIWDLRKNAEIIKLSDSNPKIRWKALQWHPEIATQLCLASEDDDCPIIQLWDLRFSTAPLKTFNHHKKGILSIAWNNQDPDLLLSCSRDNTILCWNPNSDDQNETMPCKLTQANQWNFDVAWCPRDPGLIVGSSFDGHATVYSLLGAQQQPEMSSKIVDSFPGMDAFCQPPSQMHVEPAVFLKKAPKWLKKPIGATFGFGGKLTTFLNEPTDPNTGINSKKVIVSQVITNPEIVRRSQELEMALKSEQFMDYCKGKAENSSDEHLAKLWKYIGAYFSDDVTRTFLDLLGYNVNTINSKLKEFIPQEDVNTITEGVSKLEAIQNGNAFDGTAAFDAIVQQEQYKHIQSLKPDNKNFKINTLDDEDGLITQAILVGNLKAAVDLCLASKRYTDAIILSIASGPDLLAKTQYRYFAEHTGPLNTLINSVVSENWSDVVKNSDINCWKETLVGIFTHASQEECSTLCDTLGDRLAASDDLSLKKQAQICYICSENLNKMIGVCETEIQETVELVMIMKRAVELQTLKTVTIDGNIAKILSQYAEMLATEGDLESALSYVGNNSQEPRITMLRDRLYKALGLVSSNQPAVQPIKPAQNYYETKPPVQQSGYQSAPMHWNTNNWNTNPLQNSYGMNQPQPTPFVPQQITSPSTIQSAQLPPTLKPIGQPVPNPSQPPPSLPPQSTTTTPTLSGSRPPSVGPQSRPKYMIDPSVKSGPTYGYPQSQVFNSQPQMQSYQAQNTYQANFTSSYSNLPQNPLYAPPQPSDQFKSSSSIMTPSLPSQPPQSNVYNSAPTLPAQSQVLPSEPAPYHPPAQLTGWNDPPVAKSSRAQPVAEFQPPEPIFHPLRGAAQEFNPPEESYHQHPQQQMLYNPNQQQFGAGGMQNPGVYNKPYESMPPVPQPSLQQHHHQPVQVAKIAEPEKPKLPIPQEHANIKTVFDELKNQCYVSAKNAQTKRKVEDVSKKLEILYDSLRDNMLSADTLQGLHQICQMVQSGNYTNGLAVHTQLLSGPDFSQIASFMPGIKALLQIALQLSVYLT